MESPEPRLAFACSLKHEPLALRSLSQAGSRRIASLPTGGSHGDRDAGPSRPRARTARQLVWDFLRLLRPYRSQVFWILASATVATLIGLLPPAGTKFIIDYGLSDKQLPEPWLSRFPQLADPHRLLFGDGRRGRRARR